MAEVNQGRRGRAGLVPTGTYWDPLTWEAARSAYVADLDSDPESPGSFLEWLHRALEDHAGRSPRARAEIADAEPAPPTGGSSGAKGFSKTFPLREGTVRAIEAAVINDRVQQGRVLSRSGFLREAVAAAVAQARSRRGRDLPPAPARLPTHPPRLPQP